MPRGVGLVALNILIPEGKKRQLEELSIRRDLTVSQITREIICKALKAEEKKTKKVRRLT